MMNFLYDFFNKCQGNKGFFYTDDVWNIRCDFILSGVLAVFIVSFLYFVAHTITSFFEK